jgi:ribosomal protein S18 acetylase RimI-like enzyme
MNEHSNIIIRTATKDDIGLIHTLAHEIWPAAYKEILSADQMDYMLEQIYSETSLQNQFDNNHHFLIAEENKNPVAFVSYSKLNSGIYKLQKIYVLPTQQGKGVGKFLIYHIIQKIKEQGVTALLLNVNRNNKAKQAYEHLGFKIISEEDIDIGNGYFMNDYIMEKKI